MATGAGVKKPLPFTSAVKPVPTSAVLDVEPINLAGFRLCARHVEIIGTPTLREWATSFQLATAFGEGSPFWIGDLWNYAEQRPEWRAKMPQTLADIGITAAMGTIYNQGSVARRVQGKARDLAQSLTHAEKVAALEPEEQVEMLEESKAQNWTTRELAAHVRQKQRETKVEGQAPTMHTVDVTVRLSIEALNAFTAGERATDKVKAAVKGLAHAHVIGAHVVPYGGKTAKQKRS